MWKIKNEIRPRMKDNLITLVQKADNEQIKMLYKCFTSIMNYVNKRIN